jgi:hypothetical protein
VLFDDDVGCQDYVVSAVDGITPYGNICGITVRGKKTDVFGEKTKTKLFLEPQCPPQSPHGLAWD